MKSEKGWIEVIPEAEFAPDRVYLHDGNGNIRCYALRSYDRSVLERKYEKGEMLFEIKLSIENAELLMNDLFYGEYTGA